MKHLTCILILMLLASSPRRSHAATVETDICICGGTSRPDFVLKFGG